MKSLSIASVAVAAAALSAVAVPSIALAADSSMAFNALVNSTDISAIVLGAKMAF
jgi:hypothetical protein